MTSKPTYQDLARRVRELEQEIEELHSARESLTRRETLMRKAEELALLGHWELDLTNNRLYWSEEIYRLFERAPGEFGATYEAFLDTVHPEDREFVNQAYVDSLQSRQGYDIVHRLLLRSGAVRFVREKCTTEYGPDGVALRSIGTVQDITDQVQSNRGFCGIIGRDARIQDLFDTIREVAHHDVPVLLQGESGTGKELVARAIHQLGPRLHEPFVAVNCGALPPGLLESELFGHVKGAFTGAVRARKGRFERADGGTLFLDEIADLPKPLQVKLLRVLQDGVYERVGDEKPRSVNVRIISAANRDLGHEVTSGNFRDDLYYRIKVVPITLPPLRERKADIPLLAEHFLEQASSEGRRSGGISTGALAKLIEHRWPGNVRELQGALHCALVRARGQLIRPEHLPEEVTQGRPPAAHFEATRQPGRPPHGSDTPRPRGRPTKLKGSAVQRALADAKGNKTRAAESLGVGRATLYRYLKNHPPTRNG